MVTKLSPLLATVALALTACGDGSSSRIGQRITQGVQNVSRSSQTSTPAPLPTPTATAWAVQIVEPTPTPTLAPTLEPAPQIINPIETVAPVAPTLEAETAQPCEYVHGRVVVPVAGEPCYEVQP
jgi:hypothetical protein